MKDVIAVALGGAIGAVARYGLVEASARLAPYLAWPTGTFAVNILGSLAMGVLVGCLAPLTTDVANPWRVLLGVGVLGGFTTFSAYALDIVKLLERKYFITAGGYACASVIVSVACLCIGLALARRFVT